MGLDIHFNNMPADNLYRSWNTNFPYTPTGSQVDLMQAVVTFLTNKERLKLFMIKGYAGTGKTSIISSLVKTLQETRLRTHLLAPTGRAAKVLSNYSKKPAYTIHKTIYFLGSGENGMPSLILKHNNFKNTLFIVDEASMIAEYSGAGNVFGHGNLLEDLVNFIYSGENCHAIFIGDAAQLPPVGTSVSPALNTDHLKKSYGLQVSSLELTDVVRQKNESLILQNATDLREKIRNESFNLPFFSFWDQREFFRINGQELEEALQDTYSTHGCENTIVVCRSNKRANVFNQEIRNRILFRENEISTGDLLMVVRNNYFWLEKGSNIEFIANGDMIEVQRIRKTEELQNFRFADITFRWVDYPDEPEIDVNILLNTLTCETASLPSEEMKNLALLAIEGMEHSSRKKKLETLRKDPFYNALQVKFAYAVTVHKSQGGQWEAVFIDQGYVTKEMIDAEYLRWLYTAITRSTKKVYLVNFHDMFFTDV